MRYVSGVRVPNSERNSFYDLPYMLNGVELSVSDTEAPVVETKVLTYKTPLIDRRMFKPGFGFYRRGMPCEKSGIFTKRLKPEQILGLVLPDSQAENAMCVPLTEKDIEFHKYVSATTSVMQDSYSIEGADVITTSRIGYKCGQGTGKLCVLLEGDCLQIGGYLGSCAVLLAPNMVGFPDGRGYNYKTLSLRDAIIYMCRRCNYNIMQYENVQVSTINLTHLDGTHSVTDIHFEHTAESNRYFTKLFMLEAMRG